MNTPTECTIYTLNLFGGTSMPPRRQMHLADYILDHIASTVGYISQQEKYME